jgi:hypothetical protein
VALGGEQVPLSVENAISAGVPFVQVGSIAVAGPGIGVGVAVTAVTSGVGVAVASVGVGVGVVAMTWTLWLQTQPFSPWSVRTW